MSNGSIIIFGVLSAILLIFSCIALNAPKFYNELAVSTCNPKLNSNPTVLLRDRRVQRDLN